MSFLDKWFAPKTSQKADLGRRKFLQGLITAAPAAVAAAAAIDLSFVPELKQAAREELFKLDQMVEGDIGLQGGRIMVAAPKQIFDPTARIWRSVAAEAGAWADYVTAKTGVPRDAALRVTERLARLIDTDLRVAQVDSETKIDVQLPVVTRQWTDFFGNKQCEVGMGLHKTKLFDGTEQFAVTFMDKAPRLVDGKGKVFSPPGAPEGVVDVTARLKDAPANAGWHPPARWSDAGTDHPVSHSARPS